MSYLQDFSWNEITFLKHQFAVNGISKTNRTSSMFLKDDGVWPFPQFYVLHQIFYDSFFISILLLFQHNSSFFGVLNMTRGSKVHNILYLPFNLEISLLDSEKQLFHLNRHKIRIFRIFQGVSALISLLYEQQLCLYYSNSNFLLDFLLKFCGMK